MQRAALDLTLDHFIITTEGHEIDIGAGQCFILQGGQTVNVQTREWIEFPLDYLGRVGAMAQLAKFGIMASHGLQVDPGSQRAPAILFVQCERAKSYELRSRSPIVSLEIMPLASTPSHDGKAAEHLRASGNRAEVLRIFAAMTAII